MKLGKLRLKWECDRKEVLMEVRRYPAPLPSSRTSPSHIFLVLKKSPLNLKTQCDESKYQTREGSISSSCGISSPTMTRYTMVSFLSAYISFPLLYVSLPFPDCFHSFLWNAPSFPITLGHNQLQPTITDL